MSDTNTITVLEVGRLHVRVFQTAREAGVAAGESAASHLRRLLAEQDQVRVAFAAAASQFDALAALSRSAGIDWSRVTAFLIDEYVGLDPRSPYRLLNVMRRHLYDAVRPGRIVAFDPMAADPAEEARRYGAQVDESRLDLCLLGIGENGHLAYNEPHVADFGDPEVAKVIDVDQTSRRQQIREGAFPTDEAMPTRACTLTMPTLLAAGTIIGTVVGERKRVAVRRALTGQISVDCPASRLREHPSATLHVDRAAWEPPTLQ